MEVEICGRRSEGRPTPSPEHNGCHNDGAWTERALSGGSVGLSQPSASIKTSLHSSSAQVAPTKTSKKSPAAPDAAKDQVNTRSLHAVRYQSLF